MKCQDLIQDTVGKGTIQQRLTVRKARLAREKGRRQRLGGYVTEALY